MPSLRGREAGAVVRPARTGGLTSGDLAWLLLLPAVAIAVPVVVLLAPPLGGIAFGPPPFHYWNPELLVRKPTVQAGYLLTIACVVAYAAAVLLLPADRVRVGRRRAAIVAAQAGTLAFVALAWIEQRNVRAGDVHRVHFTIPTVIVATAIAAALAWLVAGGQRSAMLARVRRALARPRRPEAAVCLAVAAAATVVWLLPAIATDRNVALESFETTFLARFAFDEATSVLNGRSPLVNMVAYGSIWPYATALPLKALGGSYLGFSLTMSALTGASLLAVYGVLRRVTRRALAALALYLPFLATSLFIEVLQHTRVGDVRYYPADYFGIFPLRYAGPYLLAWLTVRFVEGTPPRWLRPELLFGAAGLVALNNLDFGVAALGGTIAAILCTTEPPYRAGLLRLGRALATGLLGALATVSLLTLLRAGSLPHLGLLVRYGRLFAAGGFGNVALPALGFHIVVTATFVAALAVAAVRARARRPNRALTGMLAWSAIFGFGASAYFYAYRSHPFDLIDLFSAWSLALVLLAVAAMRDAWRDRRWPTAPELAVLLGFGLLVCSLAQVPHPWSDVRRLQTRLSSQPLRSPAFVAAVRAVTRPGEHVAIIDSMGHRIAREAGVVNVAPYTGLPQMDTSEQMDDVLDLLELEGGEKVFVPGWTPTAGVAGQAAMRELRRRGYAVVRRWPAAIELVRGLP